MSLSITKRPLDTNFISFMTFYYKNSVLKPTEKDTVWTEKHDEFCLENRIKPSAKLLWQWLIRQTKLSNEIEPDLKDFNAWVAKFRRNPFCRDTLKDALQQLIDLRVVHLVKRFTWRVVRIVTRSLEDLFPRKKSRQREEIRDLPTPNLQSDECCTKQQQQSFPIQDNVTDLRNAGIDFDVHDTEVVNRPNNEIKLALEMFKLRGGFEKIKDNPEGWIRTCLRERYWEEDRNYEAIVDKFGNTTIIDELFPDNKLNELQPLLTFFGLDINSLKKLPST